MELPAALNAALEGQAILIAGSGFSHGAKNIDDCDLPFGTALADHLAELCDLKEKGPLEVVADYFLTCFTPNELIEIIKRAYSVKTIAEHHRIIMSIPWKRLYTTNYDSVIEMAADHNHRKLTSITMQKNFDDYQKKDLCVHFNGNLNNLNHETLKNEFKLTDHSYSCDSLEKFRWFEFFKNDLDTAKAIFVIGFSMYYDIDIRRTLASPDISPKVLFITKPGLTVLDRNYFKGYGECFEIGVNGFSEKINEEKQKFVDSNVGDIFISFLHQYRETISPIDLRYEEVFGLYYYGRWRDDHFKTDANGKYINVLKRDAVDIVQRKLYDPEIRVFLVNADLGNGKSFFCDQIRNELRNVDCHVFQFKKRGNDLDKEISNICNNYPRALVIIDNYSAYIDILKRFRDFTCPGIKFLITCRSALHNTAYRHMLKALRIDDSQVYPIYLDELRDAEIKSLSGLLMSHSLLQRDLGKLDLSEIDIYIKKDCNARLASVLLEMIKSSDILERLKQVYDECKLERKEVRELLIFSLAKQAMNIDIDLFQTLDLLCINYVELVKNSPHLQEILHFSDNNLDIKSPILGRELLYGIVDFDDFAELMINIVKRADLTYESNESYHSLLRNVISRTHYLPFLKTGGRSETIIHFYDGIRNTLFCIDNHFFWEQFASACIDMEKFDLAQKHIETAYGIASKRADFTPFQIETIEAKLILRKILWESRIQHLSNEELFHLLSTAHELLIRNYAHNENNHRRVFSVAMDFIRVYDQYKEVFTQREKSMLIEVLKDFLNRMYYYLEEQSAQHKAQVMEDIREISKCRASIIDDMHNN